MTSMQENYVALLNLPIVHRLINKNAKLRKENKALKSLIYSLPEFRCECKGFGSSTRHVEIKKEKEDNIPVQCDTLEEDDEIVFVASDNETKKINIVYEIAEDEEEEAEDEEAEDEEAGEEEAEEEEAEEEEAEEEEDAEEETEEAEEEEAEEEEAEAEEAEEAEEEVFVVTISGKSYYTTNKDSGKIYKINADEEIGDEIGEFNAGKAKFYKK